MSTPNVRPSAPGAKKSDLPPAPLVHGAAHNPGLWIDMPEVAGSLTRPRGRSLARSRPPVALMSDEQLERRYDRVEVLLAVLRQRGDSAVRAGETTCALSATMRELVIERMALRQEIADR